jgi:hypothetical protein
MKGNEDTTTHIERTKRPDASLIVRNCDNPKVDVAMNRGLKCYIDKLKLLLRAIRHNLANSQQLDVEEESFGDVLTKEIEANLTREEISELRGLLNAASNKLGHTEERKFCSNRY